MTQWLSRLLEHLKTYISESMMGLSQYWSRTLIAFVIISSIYWLVARRHSKSRSVRELLRYWFPRELYSHPTAHISHWHYLLAFFLWGPLLALITFDAFKFALGIRGFLDAHLGHHTPLFSSEWPVVSIQAAAFILSWSFAAYWIHYAQHKMPLLWSFHRSHHSVEALTLPAFSRSHPIDNLLTGPGTASFAGVMLGVVLYTTGVERVHPTVIAMVVIYGTWEGITGVFEHSHVPFGFGWLNRVFCGPVLHQIHHSAEIRHRDKNLGNSFRLSIWDWMFGTLYIPKKGEQYRWGLNDAEYGPNNPHLTLRNFYLEPFRYAYRGLRKQRVTNSVAFSSGDVIR